MIKKLLVLSMICIFGSTVLVSRSADYPLNFLWGEFSPLAATIQNVDGDYFSVPLEYMGRQFLDYTSLNGSYPPEYELAYLMGMFGSAFEISSNWFKNWFQGAGFELVAGDLLGEKSGTDGKLYPAKINNWAKTSTNVSDCDQSKLNCQDELTFIDGAVSGLNLPMPLLNNRNVDIVFMFDASASIANSSSLQVANQYIDNGLLSRMIKFDPTWANNNSGAPVNVYNDPRSDDYDPSYQVVVYLPFWSGPEGLNCYNGFCNTFNFTYSSDQVDSVVNTTYNQFMGIKNEVQEILQAWSTKNNQ